MPKHSPLSTSLACWIGTACVLCPLPCVWLWLQCVPPTERAGWAPLPGIHNTVSLLAAWVAVTIGLLVPRWMSVLLVLGRPSMPSRLGVASVGLVAASAITAVLVLTCALRVPDRSSTRTRLPPPRALHVITTAADLWGTPPQCAEQSAPLDPFAQLLLTVGSPAGTPRREEFDALFARASVIAGRSWLTDAYAVTFDVRTPYGYTAYEQFGWPMRVITSHFGSCHAPDFWPIHRDGDIAPVPNWLAEVIVYARLEWLGLVASALPVALVLLLTAKGLQYAKRWAMRDTCTTCGYSRHGLASPACPECGTPGTPAAHGE